MTYDRYYYSTLSPSDKKAYKIIYEGIQNLKTDIPVHTTTVPLQNIVQYIGLDNPHIFYVDFNQYQYSKSLFGTTINLTYWYSKIEIDEINQKVNAVLKKMLSRVSGKTDFELEKSVHDLLIENVMYDMTALNNLHQHSPRSNSILGVLFYKTAVCEGISKVTKMLLNLLNIKCIVAFGNAGGEAHAWNIVKVDGHAYHLDVTWDINLSNKNELRYDYFNLSDDEILTDHNPGIKYPVCNLNSQNYFSKNSLVAKSILDIEKIIIKSMLQNKNTISFKYLESDPEDFKKNLQRTITLNSKILALANNKNIMYTINENQQICTLKFKE